MRAALIGPVLLLLAAFSLALPVAAQGTISPAITAPAADQALQGQVAIMGMTDVPNFDSAEIAFAYALDVTDTWFIIQNTTQPVAGGVLATWDTTSISDGNYVLRLRVNFLDGTLQDVTVPVHVRNYTALPTALPTATPTAPALQIPTPILIAASATPTLSPLPTPEPLPPNPAQVTSADVYGYLRAGALIIVGLFILVGIFLRLRHY